jgi:hypothetical protein
MMIERGFEEMAGKGGKQGRRGGGGFGLGAVLTVGLLGTCLVFCHSDKGWQAAPAQDLSADDPYPVRLDWGPEASSSPNISLFAFRDTGGNGGYDLGDPPLAGIAVRIWRPNGSVVLRRSNANGFANFGTRLGDATADIGYPGDYVFEAIAPEGWTVTTNNTEQVVRFQTEGDSRPGIVATLVPEPVGLAPELVLSGIVAERRPDGGIRPAVKAQVTLHSQGRRTRTATTDGDGRYRLLVEPGEWSIAVVGSQGMHAGRQNVIVGRVPVIVSTLLLGEATNARDLSHLRVVDFEGVTSSDLTKVPNGVAGLRWKNMIVTHKTLYGGEGYVNNAVSGDYVGYNTSGYPVFLEHPEGFDFFGGYFGGAWLSAEGERLRVRGWRGGEVAFSDEFGLSAIGPSWFDAEYLGITRLEISTAHYWQFVVDDLHFGLPPQTGGGTAASR